MSEQYLTRSSADVKRLTARYKSAKGFVEGFCTTLGLHKRASPQRASTYPKKHKRLLADKAVLETLFSTFRAKKKARISWIHVGLGKMDEI